MTAIILMILKIIGILALILIGVFLFMLGVVLFVPIRYRISAACQREPGQVFAQAKLSWLLHLLTVRIAYDNGLICKVRLFGITIYDIAKKELYEERAARRRKRKEQRQESGKKSRDKEKDKEKNKGKERRPGKQQRTQENPESCTQENARQPGPRQQTSQTGQAALQEEQGQQTVKDKDREQEQKTEQTEHSPSGQLKKGFQERFVEFFRMLCRRLKNIQYTIREFCDKIKQILDNIAYYKELLEKEECKTAFQCCKKQLFHIWRNIRPGKLKLAVEFGFDDPADTGQLVALYSMFYPWIYHTVTLEPDFEKSVLKGTFFCRGRVTVFILLKAAWILYFDKNIRTFLRLWKKEEIEHG